MTRDQLKSIGEIYFESLRNASFDTIPYHDDIVLRAPIAPGGVARPLKGKQEVFKKWWSPLVPALDGVEIEIIDHFFNESMNALFTKVEFNFTKLGIHLRVADRFIVNENGEILDQENHFDPRPMQVIGSNPNSSGINAETPGVHHIALRTMDRDRTKAFYGNLLGFRLILENEELLIYAMGRTFVAFKQAAPRDPRYQKFSPFEVGLDHIALGIESEEELRRITLRLESADVENTGVKLDETLQKLYVAFKDPDRIQWEFYMT